ncbi:MAG: beta-glycosidase, partial [Muribaculaceae bacterium]|nr:beta-glycosidase [Muribaculaceae bacterium]
MKKAILSMLLLSALGVNAQDWYVTTDGKPWQQKKASLASKASSKPVLEITGNEEGNTFKSWGTCFNELDADALKLLTEAEQQEIYQNMFAPDGDLRFTRGRLTMNANDYSRAWYSCSEVPGDFSLKYFNIDHDKDNVIPMIHGALKQNPDMTFWMSPWCPPAWMKINNDYP